MDSISRRPLAIVAGQGPSQGFYGFHMRCVYGTLDFKADRFRYVYETHVRNIRHYFCNRSDDLLILNIFEGEFIVFAWPSFWWLDYYSEFNHYLLTRYHCAMTNNRIVAFDLSVPASRS